MHFRLPLPSPLLGVVVVVMLAAALQVPTRTAADVLASSSLESCVQSSVTDISCRKKMVVALTVDNTQAIATQRLEFQLACVGRCVLITSHSWPAW